MAKLWTGLATDLDMEGVAGDPYPTGLIASIFGVSAGAGGRAESKKNNRSPSSRGFFTALTAAGFVLVTSSILISPKSRNTTEVEDKEDTPSTSESVKTKEDYLTPRAVTEVMEPTRKKASQAQDAVTESAQESGQEVREEVGTTLPMDVPPPLKRHTPAKHAAPAVQYPAEAPAQPESEFTTSKSVDTATYRELSGRY